MSLVTVDRYRTITLDTTSSEATITAAIEDAEAEVSEYLRRPLEQAERTETLPISRDGKLYPSATPLDPAAGDLADLAVEGDVVIGASPDAGELGWLGSVATPQATITYTGGWTADSLPKAIERAVALAAHHAIHTDPALVPAGATSVRVGDAAVTYGPGGASSDPLASTMANIGRYRRRFV